MLKWMYMVRLKNEAEIELMRQGGHKLALILRQLVKMVKPGLSTALLEQKAIELIAASGGEPAFKDYHMGGDLYFPTALCVSINDEVVHGPALPERILRSGDIVDLDIGMKWPKVNGLYTDTCYTVAVGKVDKATRKLLKVSEQSLYRGIKMAQPGKTLNDIGQAIEEYCFNQGYSVVKDFVGHGVGHEVHEAPDVFNYEIDPRSPENLVLVPGMVLAIEPMVNAGTWRVKIAPNGYTALTADGSLSAHFEHTVAVTAKGPIILTQ